MVKQKEVSARPRKKAATNTLGNNKSNKLKTVSAELPKRISAKISGNNKPTHFCKYKKQ
ncbi:MAG TPA: hypothetical protein VGK25_04550 [Ignavibacteria bacterium]